ncbi:MAG: tripartite tricarboxylate transporter substrate binding protein [Gammaproteobacteria bacterium]|nr:tripartite tricarboxylate transporter substrate binding protein [Gammaproteobacteria bacterium]MBU1439938.1 tripartite tricarboxylate transporter substrate binding protein [Gammaproteobacteria bacterium]MBU2287944.1 tripartite tricarboxylate transporter substrate binding protein [Gammaproteobacteria bacterium]
MPFHRVRHASRSLATLYLAGLAGVAAALGAAMPAAAQDYPAKQAIKIVVPYAAGGSTDQTARVVGKALSTELGQSVIVENRAGAGGSIGNDAVAKAAPDGYTLLVSAAGPLTVTPHTYAHLSYDPIKSFEPITLIATQPLLLVVNPQLPVHSVPELIKLAKSKKGGKLNYGSFGTGSAAHLAGEYFKTLTQVDMTHVPYKGSGPALVDLVGGQIDLMFDVFSTAAPLAKAGKLRALAISSKTRSPQFPDVPTMEEAGVAGFEAGTWFGVLAPAGTPQPIVQKLSKALNAALKQKEVRDSLESQGAAIDGGTPEAFRTFFLSEYDKWGKIVKTAGIKVD